MWVLGVLLLRPLPSVPFTPRLCRGPDQPHQACQPDGPEGQAAGCPHWGERGEPGQVRGRHSDAWRGLSACALDRQEAQQGPGSPDPGGQGGEWSELTLGPALAGKLHPAAFSAPPPGHCPCQSQLAVGRFSRGACTLLAADASFMGSPTLSLQPWALPSAPFHHAARLGLWDSLAQEAQLPGVTPRSKEVEIPSA